MTGKSLFIRLATSLALTLCTSACASLPNSSSLVGGMSVSAPAAFLDFCQRDPSDCASTPSTGATVETITLNNDSFQLLERVNRSVNDAISPRTDEDSAGVADLWSLPLAEGRHEGDCEDYALEKRRALMAAGVPSAALSLAVVESARTGRHAVLLANTDRGDFVLDNLEPWVLPWAKTRYTWIKRETGSSPTQWATLEVERIQKIVARRSDLIAMGAGDGAVGGIPSEH